MGESGKAKDEKERTSVLEKQAGKKGDDESSSSEEDKEDEDEKKDNSTVIIRVSCIIFINDWSNVEFQVKRHTMLFSSEESKEVSKWKKYNSS